MHAAVLAMHKSMARQWSKVAPLAKEAAAEARASLKGQGHEAYVAGEWWCPLSDFFP